MININPFYFEYLDDIKGMTNPISYYDWLRLKNNHIGNLLTRLSQNLKPSKQPVGE